MLPKIENTLRLRKKSTKFLPRKETRETGVAANVGISPETGRMDTNIVAVIHILGTSAERKTKVESWDI